MMQVWIPPIMALVSAILGTLVGGFLVHKLTKSREILAARRAIRTDYLISAYRRLISVSNRSTGMSKEQVESLESAVDDVMLLGEKDEINAARSFIVGMAEEHNASVDPLIQALRSSLRRELELGEVAMPSPYNLRIEMHVNEKQAGSNSLRRERGTLNRG